MQPLPGFRDFLPDDCAQRNYIFAKWREVARRYGFVEWDGPILESTDLYRKKSGDEIVGQLFNFTDKGEREVAMRPELTPTLARVVATHDREFKKPLKWFSIPQCFRYERPSRGRLREHFQLNCDIIGESSLHAEIELIALCIDLLRGFGFTADDVVVRISDREFWTEFFREHDLPKERWPEMLQVIDKSERESRDNTAKKLGVLADAVFAVLGGEAGGSAKLEGVVEALRERGLADFVKVDLGIVRGLVYYTGIVFEAHDRAGRLRALAGGGRYDQLIEQLSDGAVNLPAVGFAMGDVVLGELINDLPAPREALQLGRASHRGVDVYVIVAKEEQRSVALAHVQKLRESGYRVDYPFTPAKVGKQFQAAEQLGAQTALLFGDEWPQIAVKMLATGEQQLIGSDELLAHLARSTQLGRATD
jgi:histidyl-tRNA synthetase